VAAIQAGEPERMEELWEQVRRFVAMKARHVMTALEGRSDIELDDLIQSGYLALVEAVAGYTPESEFAFLTHLGYHLKTAFADATHFRTLRQQREALAGTLSLDAPVSDEANASTLGDFQEDPAGVVALEDAEERIYQAQLHEALEAALATIPEQSAEVLRLRHYQGLALADIGKIRGTTAERIRQMENKAIRQLQKPSVACHLRPFYDFDFYCGTGLGAFQHSGMSIQERYLVLEENLKERTEQRRKEQAEKQLKERLRSEHEEIVKRINQEAQEKVARMTPEEKRALLEKYGYA